MSCRAWLPLFALASACARTPSPAPPAPRPAPDTAARRAAPPPEVPAAIPALPPARRYATVRLAFTGDINLGTLTLPEGVPPDSGRGLLDGARDALRGDLVVGNFEGVLGDSGITYKCGGRARSVGRSRAGGQSDRRADGQRAPTRKPETRRRPTVRPTVRPSVPPPRCYAFLTPTALAPRLAEAGFTQLNLANNHSNDFGPVGRATTDSILAGLGLGLYGPLGRIALDTVRQGDSLTLVGMVGFSTYPFAYDLLDVERSVAVVDSIRPLVDLLIVTFHGGAEGLGALHTPEAAESLGPEPRGELRRWAHALIDAGADAIVGHGPHVLRGMEFYRGRLIAYSLGNFATYRGFNLEGALGVTGVLQLEFGSDRRLQRARLVPMVQLPLQGPRPDPEDQAVEQVGRLSQEDFGSAGARLSPGGEIAMPD